MLSRSPEDPRKECPLKRLAPLVALALLVSAWAGIGSAHDLGAGGRLPTPTPSPSGSPPPRVALVIMENKEYPSVIGNAYAPYVNALAKQYGLATHTYATSHPSLPNYLALTGGSTFGITSDCTDCHVSATNLVDQLQAAGVSWKAYMEGMPSACYTGPYAGRYAKKHDPFMYYDDVTGDPARCHRVVPFARLGSDLSAGTLPTFSWITPDLCHDTHDCSVATGDAFLKGLVPQILSTLGPGGVLILTWDEGSTSAGCCKKAAGGHIATIVAGPGAASHTSSAVPYDGYSILATVEDLLGLPRLRGASCACTQPMTALLK